MTEKRSLVGPACVLAPIAAAVLTVSIARLETSPPWILIITFAALAVWVDDWPHWVGRKLAWSNSAALVMAAVVIAPPTAAPVVGALVLMPTAIFASERKDFQVARFATNASHLAVDGFTIGLIVESARPGGIGPSVALLIVCSLAYVVSVALSLCTIGLVSAYRFGRTSLRDLSEIAKVMPVREAPVAIGAALLASPVNQLGSGWGFLLVLQLVALVSLPRMRARLASQRTRLITGVTKTLNDRRAPNDSQERIEKLCLGAGRSLGLSVDELQQLRYVALCYAMTESFANQLARPIDTPEAVWANTTGFSRVLFYGLALADIADPQVRVIGDAAAHLDSLLAPEPGEAAMGLEDAISQLRGDGVSEDVLSALTAAAGDDTYWEWRERIAQGYLYSPRSRRG